jgi:hypothetical protein
MRKKVIIGLAIVLAIILAVVLFGSSDKDKAAPQFARVMQGKFEVLVNVTGELKAQNSENIMAPTELRGRTFRISEVKIQDLIAEGTLVDSGDYVATLDRAALSNQLKSTEDELEKSLQAFLKVQLDTTLQLRELRNNLINLKFDMEEKQLVLDQSKYEPPATQRQAQINLDKAQRAYEQEVHNYTLKKEQAEASMKEVAINLQRQKRERQDMLDVLDKFVIRAPKPGMVIYYREWNGQKRKVGSSVSPWDLIVATLPDLSVMNSNTYVNEIDISKIKTGQPVRITVDAFPEKKFTGEVIEVANIGEQLPNTDAKVFEVIIRVNEYDPILRPSMTTGNQIITNVYDSVTYIPIEALHANDSISYVFTRKGKMQVVVPGEMNENFIIIEKGLEANDEVYLSMPEKPEKFSLAGKELISVLKKKKEQKIQDEIRLREVQDSAMKSRSQAQKMMFQMNGQQVRKNGSASKINSELRGQGGNGSKNANPKPAAPKP